MPRFYFDLKFDSEPATHDEEGFVLPDLNAAQIEATRALTDLSKEMVDGGRAANSLAVIVRDETGPVLQASLVFELKRLN